MTSDDLFREAMTEAQANLDRAVAARIRMAVGWLDSATFEDYPQSAKRRATEHLNHALDLLSGDNLTDDDSEVAR